MAKTYRVTPLVRVGNFVTTTFLRAGVPLGAMVLLTVRGRKSDVLRTTPVSVVEQAGQRYLIAPFGSVQWVRNLRAAGEATLTRGRNVEPITVVELSAAQAAPVLQQSLTKAPRFLRQYFNVSPAAPLADFEREAPRHPVFLVQRRTPTL